MKSTEKELHFINGDTVRLINLSTHEIREYTVSMDSYKYLRKLSTAVATLFKGENLKIKEINYPLPVEQRNFYDVEAIEVILERI